MALTSSNPESMSSSWAIWLVSVSTQLFFRRICSIKRCRFGVSMEEGSSGSSYVNILVWCLYSYHCTSITTIHLQNFFIFSNLNSVPLNNVSIYPSSYPLATTILFSVSMNLITLSTSYKWNHRVLLCPAGFILQNIFRVHSCYNMY